ncbi:MAG: hypothetical protein MSJ26_07500 [Oscillospiraceae bacterium]|nr:hypothetical protein [Oscillospiraceae bacterium]
MEKYVSVDKMSKKKRAEYFKRQRKGWGGLSPVTRVPAAKGAYSRAKAKAAAMREMI